MTTRFAFAILAAAAVTLSQPIAAFAAPQPAGVFQPRDAVVKLVMPAPVAVAMPLRTPVPFDASARSAAGH